MRAAVGLRWVIATMLAIALSGRLIAADTRPPADDEPGFRLVFPAGAEAKNVRAYGARGDGATDDTAAIQRAISENMDMYCAPLYFPAGTYVISETLMPRSAKSGKLHYGTILLGESRKHTVLKLVDNCAGFSDPAAPRAMVYFGSKDLSGAAGNTGDKGNCAHKNSVINMTVDVGEGNRGAIAVDNLANNIGAVRDVTIRAPAGSGFCGIEMTRSWPGPSLIGNVLVEGFDYGMRVAGREYGITLERVTLRGQRTAGITNDGNMLQVRGLRSRNVVPAIRSAGVSAMLVVLDAVLTGGASNATGIESTGGFCYYRNVRAAGYGAAASDRGKKLGPVIGEYVPGKTTSLFPSPRSSLNLPVEDAPELPYDPPSQWAIVRGRGARSFQAAIDSKRTTVCLRPAWHELDGVVKIRGNVRRIFGMNAWIGVAEKMRGKATWVCENTTQPVIVIEHMRIHGFEHRSKSTVVFRHCEVAGYTALPGAGNVFIEDVLGSRWTFAPGQKIWARQYNPEGQGWNVRNNGARLWVLGYKIEGASTTIATTGGGFTEVLGAFLYPCKNIPEGMPLIVNDESSVSIMYSIRDYVKAHTHEVQIEETRDGETRTLERRDVNWHYNLGRVPLYLGYKTPPAVLDARVEARAKSEGGGSRSLLAARANRPPKPTDDGLRMWTEYLLARVFAEAQAGRTLSLFMSLMRRSARVVGADADGMLDIDAGGVTMKRMISTLTLAERRSLALAVMDESRAEDRCAAAFFHLATGEKMDGDRLLAGTGEGAATVRASFERTAEER